MMPEVLVETIPFVIGAVLGLLMFDSCRPWPNLIGLGLGSILVGVLQAAFAGELAGDLITGATAVVFDSAAVAVAWVIVHVSLRQERALLRRSRTGPDGVDAPNGLGVPEWRC